MEFAVCLPMLMILILGSMEASSTISLKQGLQAACSESVRQAIKAKTTDQEVIDRARQILNSRGIQNATVELEPGSVASVPRGERVAVRVSAPIRGNSPFIGKVISNRTLTTRLVMLKE